jgi:hypothetical protein
MCSGFRLENSGSVFNGLQEYADESRKNVVILCPLTNAVKTILCSTADYELAFIVMNITVTKL